MQHGMENLSVLTDALELCTVSWNFGILVDSQVRCLGSCLRAGWMLAGGWLCLVAGCLCTVGRVGFAGLAVRRKTYSNTFAGQEKLAG